MNNLKILCVVGMPGSGKSTITNYLAEQKHPRIYFGGIILDRMKQQNIEITPENETSFRESLREKHGNDFLINIVIEEIRNLANAGQKRIILDGLYSWTEYRTLKSAFPTEVITLAVTLPKTLRHSRIKSREERPLDTEEINHRDYSEIENLEKGGPIAIADYYIDNSSSEHDLHKNLDDLLSSIEF
jgi:dephospho-CoA kinase